MAFLLLGRFFCEKHLHNGNDCGMITELNDALYPTGQKTEVKR